MLELKIVIVKQSSFENINITNTEIPTKVLETLQELKSAISENGRYDFNISKLNYVNCILNEQQCYVYLLNIKNNEVYLNNKKIDPKNFMII